MVCYARRIKHLPENWRGGLEMKLYGLAAAFAVASLSTPAVAIQASDIESFIGAVRDRDGNKATQLLNTRRAIVVNGRNMKGDTGLLVAVARRDELWTGFLLQQGANPNLASRSGETPLMAAARVGFERGAEALLATGAKVDATNRMGETALILAVQQRSAPIVRLLLDKGADPDKADAAAGYSARDYAKRDSRAREVLALIEGSKRSSDKLEDFKLK
jgi:ankyrin repeat protein